jgi:hypothetical protein
MVRRLFIDPLTPSELDAVASVAEKVLAVLATDRNGAPADGTSRGDPERPSA